MHTARRIRHVEQDEDMHAQVEVVDVLKHEAKRCLLGQRLLATLRHTPVPLTKAGLSVPCHKQQHRAGKGQVRSSLRLTNNQTRRSGCLGESASAPESQRAACRCRRQALQERTTLRMGQNARHEGRLSTWLKERSSVEGLFDCQFQRTVADDAILLQGRILAA